MEQYITDSMSDITYMPELTPPFWADLNSFTTAKRAGLIRTYNLRHAARSVSYVLIKCLKINI